MATVVTSFSKRGLHEYGYHFIESFDAYWAPEVELLLYAEKSMPRLQSRVGRKISIRYLGDVPNFKEFFAMYRENPLYAGRAPHACWKPKDYNDGYSFRTDALKFCRKVFAVAHAASNIDDNVLAWIDADVRCLARPPRNFIEALLGDSACAYLGRDNTHSECGFLAFRIPEARALIDAWEAMYRTGIFVGLSEWHDSFLFDHARVRHCSDIPCRNLTPGGRGHVWCDSALAPYMDHLKGERKLKGFSPERLDNEARR